MVVRRAVATLAAQALLGMMLGGCAAAAAPGAARVTAAAPTPTAAADVYRSPRTYRAVAAPVRVRIPAIGVDSMLERVRRAADGTMGLPVLAEHAAWWAEGPRPGQPGPAVILGHVDWGGPAVFFRLTELRPGDLVYVDRSDRSTVRFRVTGSKLVPKSDFPTEAVYGPNLTPALRLVTCGGSFDRTARRPGGIGSYRDNVIVFAAPG